VEFLDAGKKRVSTQKHAHFSYRYPGRFKDKESKDAFNTLIASLPSHHIVKLSITEVNTKSKDLPGFPRVSKRNKELF
jgi:hypothetical protein